MCLTHICTKKGPACCLHYALNWEMRPFGQAWKHYLTNHQFDTVHTRHFQRAMEFESRNLDRFFDQWIFSPGHPDLKVDVQQRKGLLLVDVTQVQKGDDVPDAYCFTLSIDVVLQDGTTHEFHYLSRTIATNIRPSCIRCDSDGAYRP